MHRLHFSVMHDAELRRLALVGTLQQRQGVLAGIRVDLRARFDAPLGLFSCGRGRFLLLLFLGLLLGILRGFLDIAINIMVQFPKKPQPHWDFLIFLPLISGTSSYIWLF